MPLQLHLNEGRVKVLMALARGRKSYDKRQVLARRDADLEARRAVATALKGRLPQSEPSSARHGPSDDRAVRTVGGR